MFETTIATILIQIIIIQYVVIYISLWIDSNTNDINYWEFKNKKHVKLHLIPYYFIYLFIKKCYKIGIGKIINHYKELE